MIPQQMTVDLAFQPIHEASKTHQPLPGTKADTMSGPGDGSRTGAVPNEQSGGRGV